MTRILASLLGFINDCIASLIEDDAERIIKRHQRAAKQQQQNRDA